MKNKLVEIQTIDYLNLLNFYKEKIVLLTGHTGFKGSWLTYILLSAGAKVIGYSLEPSTNPSLFKKAQLEKDGALKNIIGDIRDFDVIRKIIMDTKPEIVFHLAAQPIVRDSYRDPVTTYGTNVMGTVNLLECVRQTHSVRSFLNVTTDKVYKNNEWDWGYREMDELDGYDPYSNSKSCSELVTHSFKKSFFKDSDVRVSTARAGNVIGGGDFAQDRIIPDCMRALMNAKGNKAIVNVRNPHSIRPYEHVLEPLFAYLMIAARQYENKKYEGYYNVGPDDQDCIKTGNLVSLFCEKWNEKEVSKKISWRDISEPDAPHEAHFLKLDCSKIKSTFDWKPRWHIEETIENTVTFAKIMFDGGDIRAEMDREIEAFINAR